jgi:transposase
MPSHAAAPARRCSHIVVSKFDDHLPLHRQAEREAGDLDAVGLGRRHAGGAPLVDALKRDVMAVRPFRAGQGLPLHAGALAGARPLLR